jgi:hypothetical protein
VSGLLSRWLNRPCYFHDRPAPGKIARLEVETGIDPGAMDRMWERAAGGDLVESFYDPDILDCGSRRCRKRRGLEA